MASAIRPLRRTRKEKAGPATKASAQRSCRATNNAAVTSIASTLRYGEESALGPAPGSRDSRESQKSKSSTRRTGGHGYDAAQDERQRRHSPVSAPWAV